VARGWAVLLLLLQVMLLLWLGVKAAGSVCSWGWPGVGARGSSRQQVKHVVSERQSKTSSFGLRQYMQPLRTMLQLNDDICTTQRQAEQGFGGCVTLTHNNPPSKTIGCQASIARQHRTASICVMLCPTASVIYTGSGHPLRLVLAASPGLVRAACCGPSHHLK
jgi:hypothetical protein